MRMTPLALLVRHRAPGKAPRTGLRVAAAAGGAIPKVVGEGKESGAGTAWRDDPQGTAIAWCFTSVSLSLPDRSHPSPRRSARIPGWGRSNCFPRLLIALGALHSVAARFAQTPAKVEKASLPL